MKFSISGLGTAVPPHRMAQSDAARLASDLYFDRNEQRRVLPVLYRRTGVRYRHSVLLDSPGGHPTTWQPFYPPAKDEKDRGPTTRERMERYELEAGPLAARAARNALDDAGVDAAAITGLVTASCTGFAAPGVDMALIETLGLSPGVSRTHVGFMGCHGALNAIRAGAALASGDAGAPVLVSAVELCSLHQQYEWTPDNVVANALFADGAAALVGRSEPAGTDGDGGLQLLASASRRLEGCAGFMTWRIGDHGFSMTLSAAVPEVIRERLLDWLVGWLGEHGWRLEDIGAWGIHPGGPRVLSACADALDLGPEEIEPSRSVLGDFGNMSSPTVLFILERLRQSNAPLPWVLLAFGPGLAIEAMLLGSDSERTMPQQPAQSRQRPAQSRQRPAQSRQRPAQSPSKPANP